MKTAADIRSTFLDFFGRNGHEVVASSPLVPRNDPTLMFTTAGMVQFKNIFTGMETRSYRRAATAQKCVRAGGKHNDLENVGYTARHHTFFEMLGNFSFGDYFKETAIDLAWTLITREYGLPKDRLLVTVYHDDDEAADLWRRIAGLPDERIIRIATSDNFWSMGDTGPCGPCSEIFFDHGPKVAGGPPGSDDADGDRFIEIWNLVFMQFEQRGPGDRVALPKPSIDTGMGLERLSAILQGQHDNYDVDLLRRLIEASAQASGVEADGPHRVSHRVIADHLRSSAFLIADGVLPSNEGRGYVLRRIMRRAMRHAHILGCRDPLLWRLVPTLVKAMGEAYPELVRAQTLITETLSLEETRFKITLDRGLKLLDDELGRLPEAAPLSGRFAFTLYDSYGFPLDLTADVLRSRGRTVEQEGFDAAMAEQRAKARAAWAGSGEAATGAVWFAIRERTGATEFLGYDTLIAEGQVAAVLVGGAEVAEAGAGTEIELLANQTPFYGESGGQMGDAGRIVTATGAVVTVRDTAKLLGDLHVHRGVIDSGVVRVGDAAEFQVDGARRGALRANHSATHLLHEALRRTLGEHVTQKGSLVAPDRLRFDISHPKPITAEELAAVESEVNRRIRINSGVSTRLMQPDEAIAAGAMALFGEKYGDEVRVVAMGGDEDTGEARFSVELCGGTHVRRTGDIGLFRIVAESAVSAGVRRIEAVTGVGALSHIDREAQVLREAATVLKAPVPELPTRIQQVLDDRRRLEREVVDLRKRLASGDGASGSESVVIGGVQTIAKRLDGVPARELKGMVDAMKQQLGSGVVMLAAVDEGRVSLVVGVTADLVPGVDAVALVRAGAEAVGGKGGGGRPDLAQAGGPDATQVDAALAAMTAVLAARAAA
ncbi:MAG: alanine--tRNA ligase [Alphaproteobacteria bacterium]|nr:MAG: alanine--tRNA ligase [Alphaproteobacteria bacterium]